MTRRGRVTPALAVLSSCLLIGLGTDAASAAPGPEEPGARKVFSLSDDRISEASALVDLGSVMLTANDSGHPPIVFVLDARTGRTVGTTRLRTDTVDVEALAPSGRRHVWLGDIGDNARVRDSIAVHRLPVGRGDRTVSAPAHRLAYPDGAHDAESLFTDRDGRLYVITKAFTGGTVYRAPLPLSSTEVNRLERIGQVSEFATDAAMAPGDRALVVRGLGQAAIYSFPALERLGTFPVPASLNGEGISIGPDGRIRTSMEGDSAPVHEVTLPRALARLLAAPTPSPAPSPTPTPGPVVGDDQPGERAGPARPVIVLAAALGVGAIAVGLLRRRAR